MADINSIVWGGSAPVSQPFGVYNAQLASWYSYAANYGWPAGTHIGVDIAIPKFTPIKAAQSGRVSEAGWSDSFRPNPVRVIEDDGDEAVYGHLWSASVVPGQKVKRGQLLGYSGEQTKQGTMIPDGSGPHLHFELRRPDPITGGYMAVDPGPELRGAVDDYDPGSSYAKNPYAQLGYSLALDTSSDSGFGRILIGLAGGVAAVLGVWVLMGAPTNLVSVAKGVIG